jgi:hypothetical protein
LNPFARYEREKDLFRDGEKETSNERVRDREVKEV